MLCDYISHCGNVSEMQLRLYPKNLIQCTNTTNKKKKTSIQNILPQTESWILYK